MKRLLILVLLASLLEIALTAAAPEKVAGLPLHLQRLDPKTVRLWVGDSVSSTATVAFATKKGIVVVDTLGIPRVDAELRKVIARELGRSDFKVLIVTHEHGDHTGGNAVYADCTIVGHELVSAGMDAQREGRAESLAWYDKRMPEREAELAKAPAGSPAALRLKEEMALDRLNREALETNAAPPPPNLTFSDRMTFSMGDTRFELYFTGGMHSASDIAIFVPERGMLLTGDTMADVWLTDTPGCLASFMARQGVRHDFPRLLENWGLLLQKKDQIHRLLPGHWNGELSFKGFEDRVNYVRTLWEAVNRAAQEGRSLDAVQAECRLDTRFPDLAKSPGFSGPNHYRTLMELWTVVTGQESAAARYYALVDEGASDEALKQLLATRGATPAKYYFLEDQFTAYGYRFLQDGKTPQAIRVFRAYVELYPDSWNAYDSLGEALLKSGDTAGAQKMYEKSVSLKPDSKSGLEALQKIRGTANKP